MTDATKLKTQARWYVYELVDPRDGLVFYVGKGTGNRIFEHERQAARGVCSKKCNRINEIRNNGLDVVRRQVAVFWCEEAAYDHETERIDLYGLDNLTNVMPGGSGAWSLRVEELERRRKEKSSINAVDAVLRLRGRLVHWLVSSDGGRVEATPPMFVGGSEQERKAISAIVEAAYKALIPSLWAKAVACVERRRELAAAFRPYGVELIFADGYGSEKA